MCCLELLVCSVRLTKLWFFIRRFHGQGFQEGLAEGSQAGMAEGRRYGALQGARIGSEVNGKTPQGCSLLGTRK